MAERSRPSSLKSILANWLVPSFSLLLFPPLADALVPPQVVVGGSEEAVNDLANSCKAISSMTQEIYTPLMGELITVGEETKNFSVRLGDSIMASLRLSRVSRPLLALLRRANHH